MISRYIGREYRSPLILSCTPHNRLDTIKYRRVSFDIEHLAFRARRKKEEEQNLKLKLVRLFEKKEEQRSRDKVRIYIKGGIHFGKVWDGTVCVCVEDFERNSQGQYKHTQVFGD